MRSLPNLQATDLQVQDHLQMPDQQVIDAALLAVGRMVQSSGYRFTTVTPDTHAIIRERMGARSASNLREVLGWNLPFTADLLPERLLKELRIAQAIDFLDDGRMRARIRCSTIGEQVFLHSSYPTSDRAAVFFGPDTYRFVHLLRRVLGGGERLLDIGTGSGAAALSLAERYDRLVLTDINPLAVRYARINAALAGVERAQVSCCDVLEPSDVRFDAIIANPPFIIDPAHRIYRDGGRFGIAVTLRMIHAALAVLAPGGCLVVYTGAPVVAGRDLLAGALKPLLHTSGRPAHYEELDVDVFGQELQNPCYAEAGIERLAVVSLIVGSTARYEQIGSKTAPAEMSAWCWP